jgi:hypothetical protein
MSQATILQFFEELKKDKALSNEYNSAVASAMRQVVSQTLADVAAKHGFELTEQELGSYLESKAEELSEQELETVSAAGPVGTISTFSTNPWLLARVVASTIAVPEALDDGDDDRSSA